MELQINNKKYTVEGVNDESLLTVLREYLDLTGSKYGCGEGACGACTVLVEDKAVRSCLTQASSVVGKKITTIEGLEQNGKLHAVQTAFVNADAFQCAYCASGMIMSAVSLLQKNTNPSDEEIMREMQGNICRCGIYPRIIKAIREASTV
ncbi:MAG TPA: (2Fe-2S)-binding protein [Chryseolinea sp.]|jgi:aerobic-type carbon monoxide dehydrogenase small subunit (CoxS/CutS family)|nr:(2Fe-2S)-binding protein [Chryseolinea sp.]